MQRIKQKTTIKRNVRIKHLAIAQVDIFQQKPINVRICWLVVNDIYLHAIFLYKAFEIYDSVKLIKYCNYIFEFEIDELKEPI